jgi:hypothetical protein
MDLSDESGCPPIGPDELFDGKIFFKGVIWRLDPPSVVYMDGNGKHG